MFNVELKPEIRKELKDPDRFAKGMGNIYTGLVIAMSGVAIMLVLFFKKPEDVLKPSWVIFIGLGIVAWGEWQKFRSK
ncbi:MAG: hypothetical protein ACE5EK_00475 [Nitrospinales bacterium]